MDSVEKTLFPSTSLSSFSGQLLFFLKLFFSVFFTCLSTKVNYLNKINSVNAITLYITAPIVRFEVVRFARNREGLPSFLQHQSHEQN